MYAQLAFAIDRARACCKERAGTRRQSRGFDPLRRRQRRGGAGDGDEGADELVGITTPGSDPQAFEAWPRVVQTPPAIRPFSGPTPPFTYVPMLELLELLRVTGFRTLQSFSGGGGGVSLRRSARSSTAFHREQVIGAPAFRHHLRRPVIAKR